MQNMDLKMWNKLVDSTEGLEINLKVGKECELSVKGNFMAMAKVVGVILEKDSLESQEHDKNTIREFKNELDGLLEQIR